jgi:hypothetical protein
VVAGAVGERGWGLRFKSWDLVRQTSLLIQNKRPTAPNPVPKAETPHLLEERVAGDVLDNHPLAHGQGLGRGGGHNVAGGGVDKHLGGVLGVPGWSRMGPTNAPAAFLGCLGLGWAGGWW